MSNHRSATPRRRSGRTRALLSLGAVAVLATGMSVNGTYALWSDSATATTGTFSSGSLDVTLDGGLVGQGGTKTITGAMLTGMVPGESKAFGYPIANSGTVPVTYTLTGSASGALAPAMQFSVHAGAGATVGNTTTAGLRTGTCGGTPVGTANTVLGAATPIIGTAAARTLAPTGPGATSTELVCVVAKLNPQADSAMQGKTMTASLVFDARQVGGA